MTLSELLEKLVAEGGSDLYLINGAAPTIKAEGQLLAVGADVLDETQILALLQPYLTKAELDQFNQEHERNFAIDVKGLGRFRLNLYHQKGSTACVCRHVPHEIPTPEALHIPSSLKSVFDTKSGLILVVGATGVGKSTTIASLLDHRIQAQPGHVITLEDPTEFLFEHGKSLVSQRELGSDTIDHAAAMKNALRQAPSVIYIGEIRTLTAMEHALTIAQTGHLCVATLHANNAYQALERVLNFFEPSRRDTLHMDLAFHIKGVISQRLVPVIKGGREAIFEIMLDSPYVKELLKRGDIAALPDAIQKGEGMQTFDDALEALFNEGKISEETALAFADSPNNLALKIRKNKDTGDNNLEILDN